MTLDRAHAMLAWRFDCDDGLTAKYRGGLPRQRIEPGLVLKHAGPVRLCARGLHASVRAIDALQFATGAIVSRVWCWGDVETGDDKLVCSRRETVWAVDATAVLHEFACAVATESLTAERAAGREPDARSWAAINAKRRWVCGEISDSELADAREAAWDAARGAARAAAAWAAAAWAAAWDAARGAASAAAWPAARAAAWPAARDAQNKKLETMLAAEAWRCGRTPGGHVAKRIGGLAV